MLILGHRGSVHETAPENTLASVARALAQGADGIEVDVRLTADGVLVCLHDPNLSRLTGVRADLSRVPRVELPLVDGHPIPSLPEVLALVGGRGRLVIELKKPAPGAVGTLEALQADLELHAPYLGDVVVSSFDRPSLRRLRLLVDRGTGPRLRTALLGRPGMPLGVLLQRAVADGHDEVHPHVLSLLTRLDLVPPAREAGITVTGWTVNRRSDLVRMAAAGVEAVICDDPAAARSHLTARALDRTA